ncbi:unnamed protein product [Effrenium voratum]|nr:unnamed protein product [Effrenium voratum]
MFDYEHLDMAEEEPAPKAPSLPEEEPAPKAPSLPEEKPRLRGSGDFRTLPRAAWERLHGRFQQAGAIRPGASELGQSGAESADATSAFSCMKIIVS